VIVLRARDDAHLKLDGASVVSPAPTKGAAGAK